MKLFSKGVHIAIDPKTYGKFHIRAHHMHIESGRLWKDTTQKLIKESVIYFNLTKCILLANIKIEFFFLILSNWVDFFFFLFVIFYTVVLDLTIKKFQCINIRIVDNGKKQGDKKYDCTIQINCYIDLWFHFAHEWRDFDQR